MFMSNSILARVTKGLLVPLLPILTVGLLVPIDSLAAKRAKKA